MLDTGVIGQITNPKETVESRECNEWLEFQLSSGLVVFIPEICDYEIRRELIRAGKKAGIERLDQLKIALQYLPINTQTMMRAAELWADVRKKGRPAADDKSLDADVILAAQALGIRRRGYDPLIATTNVKHLDVLSNAKHWRDI